MKRISGLLILYFCLTTAVINGQTPFFQQYHPLKKNQPLPVNSILQDKKGFIWVGSDNGLFRFDGARFKQYASGDSLVDSRITALAEDSLGRIWIGHSNGLISFIEKDALHVFETREGSAVEAVSDILFDRHGTMWFSTRNDGLYYYVNERLFRVDQEEGLPDLFIYDLFEDPSGNIWAGTDAGIAVCSLTDGKISIRLINSDDGLSDIIIKKIKTISGDTIGLATEDAGMLTYNLTTKKISPLVSSWDFGAISDFVVKGDQTWISTPRTGVVVYDRKRDATRLLTEFNSLTLSSVNTLLKDREDNIWTGSKAGLARTPGDVLEHIEIPEAGSDQNVLAVAIDSDDRLWFSTSQGLFVRSQQQDGSFTVTRKLQNSAFRDTPVISLYADPYGYVWAGLYGNGLLRIHPSGNEIKHFQKELRNGNILGITGRADRVWVATLGGSSSIRFSGDRYEIANYSSADGLSSDFIYQVFMDSKGRTWFATDGKGVSMLDQAGFHQYNEGLSSKVVYSLTEDKDKNIWISSQDSGVSRFDGSKFVNVPGVRLRDNSIQALVADRDGHLIAMHNYGIDAYDISSKKMRHWGEESGIREQQPNLNAIAMDKHGQYFVGTTRGIMKFTMNNDRSSAVPVAAIDAVRIFGEPIDISATPQLNYNENNVTIQYLGFWYQNASNLNYLYTLENYDLEWIATRNQEVTYSRLPAGDYTFRLKVSETEDFTNAPETTVSFSVKPPFWRTGTFYVFIIALFFISAYGLMKYRERSLMEDKLILEARVEERTKEIQMKTEEIQAQNEEIMAQAEEIQGINENLEMLVKQRTAELEKKNKALEEYAFINAHKLRSPVASILGLVNLLAKSDQKDETRLIREHLQESADKLDAVVRSITQAIEKADNKYL